MERVTTSSVRRDCHGVDVKGLTERSKGRLAEALATFIFNRRCWSVGRNGRVGTVRRSAQSCAAKFQQRCVWRCKSDIGRVRHTDLCVNTSKISKETLVFLLIEEDWVLLCNALEDAREIEMSRSRESRAEGCSPGKGVEEDVERVRFIS